MNSKVEPAPMASQPPPPLPETEQNQQVKNDGEVQGATGTGFNCKGCDRCHVMIRPVQDQIPNTKTHLIALLLFIIGLPFLIFLPYCFNWGGTTTERCPRCGYIMGPAK